MDSLADGIMTLGMMVLFIALVALAFSASRKASEDAARMPLDDDDTFHNDIVSTTPGETARH